MHLEESITHVVRAFEVAGLVILAIGSIAAIVGAPVAMIHGAQRRCRTVA